MKCERKFYRCEICGNIVGLIHNGGGELVCCGQPMDLLTANTFDASQEKHVPVISKDGNNITVKIGSDEHPMTDAHYIQWVYLSSSKGGQRKCLAPNYKPEVTFCVCDADDNFEVFAYCNLHGLWTASL
ncbi:MAG: desulfoferrodoxin [Firmicutes bacterium]|nr:desulfoferrodoxin [Bacillota bacterium]